MNHIKVIHNYTIGSLQQNYCQHNRIDLFIILSLIGTVSIATTLSLSYYYKYISFMILITLFTIWILFVCFIYGHFFKSRCGCKILLFDSRNNKIENTEYYQFTDNPEKDTKAIKQIVDGFERVANRLYDEKQASIKKENENATFCCNKYNSIIEKIKNE